ncbi:hypothetical protein [Pollutimonas bauzanensis]|uniref:Glycine zipper 2TM domain-containing protein n=1 Tax=Pollutimonas bauzanensis TaxID=658167 RepID=A0A1M5MMP5_9BURK|nr:hypothetical protein [Pollutimonas bauzanensis]SHG78541.1 hypothetical protein SAMN04488135_101265 [Pollutimonas bauzanensis]
MKLPLNLAQFAIAGLMALAVATSASAADRKTTNTLLGAGLGAVAGAVLTQGDPLLTLGGAAAGGLLGNVLTEDRGRSGWKQGGARPRVERRQVAQRYRHDRRDRGLRHR